MQLEFYETFYSQILAFEMLNKQYVILPIPLQAMSMPKNHTDLPRFSQYFGVL